MGQGTIRQLGTIEKVCHRYGAVWMAELPVPIPCGIVTAGYWPVPSTRRNSRPGALLHVSVVSILL